MILKELLDSIKLSNKTLKLIVILLLITIPFLVNFFSNFGDKDIEEIEKNLSKEIKILSEYIKKVQVYSINSNENLQSEFIQLLENSERETDKRLRFLINSFKLRNEEFKGLLTEIMSGRNDIIIPEKIDAMNVILDNYIDDNILMEKTKIKIEIETVETKKSSLLNKIKKIIKNNKK